jgi:CDP-glucose 4,6-dehydratase
VAGRHGTVGEARAMNTAFWKDRSVFITGHTGFKGAWLTLWLHHVGARITGYALAPPTDPSLFALADAGNGICDLRGDVRDASTLESAIQCAQPEVVLHLAAQSLVRISYQAPVETYATNVMGTVHLLDAIRRTPGVRAVVVVTSDKCYENREWDRGYREDDPMGGYDPYSSSKGCAELITAAYRRSFFQDAAGKAAAIATGRAGNVIGGGDWAPDRLLPDLLNAFAGGRPAVVRNPLATRPWQHVLEPLRGYLALAERLWAADRSVAEGWNFGPQESDMKSVAWIADSAAQRWGAGAAWERDPAMHPHEAHSLILDVSKAEARLGWRPALTAADAIEWTVRWHRGLQDGESARVLTMRDICHYGDLVIAMNRSLP